jgi:hypothetical protein
VIAFIDDNPDGVAVTYNDHRRSDGNDSGMPNGLCYSVAQPGTFHELVLDEPIDPAEYDRFLAYVIERERRKTAYMEQLTRPEPSVDITIAEIKAAANSGRDLLSEVEGQVAARRQARLAAAQARLRRISSTD